MTRTGIAIPLAILSLVSIVYAEQITITGAVNGPDGAPVPDCAVGALCPPPTGTLRWPLLESTTGPDGRFQMAFECDWPRSAYAVIAMKQGFAVGWKRLEPGLPGEIALGADPATCTGSVVDNKGRPIPNAQVWVRTIDVRDREPKRRLPLWDAIDELQTTTDQAGRFQLPGLPRDCAVGLAASGDGWANYYEYTPAAWHPVSEPVTIVLEPDATISGRVTHDGAPVEGVTVMASSGPVAGKPGGSGHSESAEDGT